MQTKHPTSIQPFLQSLPPTISATQTMKALINLTLIPTLNPKILLTKHFSIQTFKRSPSTSRSLLVKCSSEQRDNEGLKDVLSGMVDKRVEELLNREENRVLLDGLEKASRRVEIAKKELEDIERQEIEATQLRNYINHLEIRASEIAECQKEILEARSMVEEAESSLTLNLDGFGSRNVLQEKESEQSDRDEERWESVKAVSVSAIVGTLAGLPFSFSQGTSGVQLILPLAITFISCALFGVTFRYTIRRDLDNVQLKTGTSAAFGFIKGLSVLGEGPPLELDYASFLSHAVDGAVYVSENFFIFFFAAVGLDYCFKTRLLSPFPIKKQFDK